MINCEICNKELKEEELQHHLIDEHKLLFSQYIGLISKKINFVNDHIVIKQKGKKK